MRIEPFSFDEDVMGRTALAVGVAVGPVVAFHVYIQDYLLALPLVLILAGKAVERRPTVTGPSAHNISQHPGSHVLDR